jgi:hypothetical protein
VSENLMVISETAKAAGGRVDQMLGAADGLTLQAKQLRDEVDRFLSEIRAAA